MRTPWLPAGFEPPRLVELPTGHHMRPIRGDDVQIDYPAVMGSRSRLWAKYGDAWGWPPAGMSYQQDLEDLERHEHEMETRESFNYAVLDREESRLVGCVYLDPPGERGDADVRVSWWVVDDCVGSELERHLACFVVDWVAEVWGFSRPDFSP
jgi:hypothetical protein